jgi:hypothetical protein
VVVYFPIPLLPLSPTDRPSVLPCIPPPTTTSSSSPIPALPLLTSEKTTAYCSIIHVAEALKIPSSSSSSSYGGGGYRRQAVKLPILALPCTPTPPLAAAVPTMPICLLHPSTPPPTLIAHLAAIGVALAAASSSVPGYQRQAAVAALS